MRVSSKKLGLGVVALAVALMGSAAIADKAHDGGKGGPMGRMGPSFDFVAADTDKDGKVTTAEFSAYRAAMVAEIDTDKDGLLSAEELVAIHTKRAADRAKEQSSRMVQDLDADGDGKLSVAEMIAMPVPPDAFEAADTSNDGVIDQAEADAAMKAMMHGPEGENGQHGKHRHHGKHRGGNDQGGN